MDPDLALDIYKNSTLHEILDEMVVRFILYLPDVELSSVERICFHLEEAHWYYEDFVRETNLRLPSLKLKEFVHRMFAQIPQSLISHIPVIKAETAFTTFISYKQRVPVRGGILLNPTMDRCLLVKGWKNNATWGFPRGKIDENEPDMKCAVREVLEETGYDCTGMTVEGDFIESQLRQQLVRLYVVPGVEEDFPFEPQTRKEISKIEWHKISDLNKILSKKDKGSEYAARAGKYYMVYPFLRELRKWIGTKGKAWLAKAQQEVDFKQQDLADAAKNINTIGEETDYETDVYGSSMTGANTEADQAAGLKSLLGVGESAAVKERGYMSKEQMRIAEKRLMETIGVRAHEQSQPQHSAAPAPSTPQLQAETLLSILNTPATSSSQPADMNSSDRHINPIPYPSTYSNGGRILQRQASMPVFTNGNRYAEQDQTQAFWHQQPPQHLQHTPGQRSQHIDRSSFNLPSPPQTSRLPPTSSVNVGQAPFPMRHQNAHPDGAQQQHNNQPLRSARRTASMNYMMQNAPPTPIDAQLPHPTRAPEPGQAGTLLSILKGSSSTPPPTQASKQSPPNPAQREALLSIFKGTPPAAAPQEPYPAASNMPASPSPPAPYPAVSNMPNGPRQENIPLSGPSSPIALQAPPKGPRRAVSGHHGLASPGGHHPRHPYNYPRSQTPRHRGTPPPTFKKPSTPVPIEHYGDHYGSPKASEAPKLATFDRRESVSGPHQQSLLSMFRQPSQQSESAIASSPEQLKAAPKPTGSLQSKSKPLPALKSRDRAQLLQYLESVSK